MLRWLAPFTVLFSGLVLERAPAQEPASGSVEIVAEILDVEGAPIRDAGAAVGLEEDVTTSDALERPVARSDREGRLRVRVPIEPDAQVEPVVVIAAPGRTAVVVSLDRRARSERVDLGALHLFDAVTVHGRVRDAAGAPLPGVRVESSDLVSLGALGYRPGPASVAWHSSACSGDDGVFALRGMTTAPAKLSFRKAGYYSETLLPVHADTPLSVELAPSGFVSGRLLDAKGEGFAGAVGVVWEMHHDGTFATRSAPDGHFAVPVSGRGRFRLSHSEPAFGQVLARSDILDGPAEQVEVRIGASARGRSVRLAVTAGGEPVAGALVAAYWGHEPEHPARMRALGGPLREHRTDASGELRLPVPGSWLAQVALVVRAPGYGDEAIGVALAADDATLEAACALAPEATVAGTVRDGAGRPCAGVPVVAVPRVVNAVSFTMPADAVRTDGEGRYRIAALPAGAYVVQADAPGHAPPPSMVVELATAEHVQGIDFAIPERRALRARLVGRPVSRGWCVRRAAIGIDVFFGESARYVPTDPIAPRWLGPRAELEYEGLEDEAYDLVLVAPALQHIAAPVELPLGALRPGPDVRGPRPVPAPVQEVAIGGLTPAIVRGKVAVSGLPDAHRGLCVVARAASFSMPRRYGGSSYCTVSAIEVDGSFALRVPAGEFELAVFDPLTAVRLHQTEANLRIGAGEAAAVDLRVEACRVTVRLVPEQPEGPVAADRLQVIEVGDSGEWQMLRMVAFAAHDGIAVGNTSRTCELLLPPGIFELVASNRAGYLHPADGVYRSTELAKQALEVGGRGTKEVKLALRPPPETKELR